MFCRFFIGLCHVISSLGKFYGLNLELNIEQYEYDDIVNDLQSDAGVQVIIAGDRQMMISPERTLLSSVGGTTSVELRKKEVRLTFLSSVGGSTSVELRKEVRQTRLEYSLRNNNFRQIWQKATVSGGCCNILSFSFNVHLYLIWYFKLWCPSSEYSCANYCQI